MSQVFQAYVYSDNSERVDVVLRDDPFDPPIKPPSFWENVRHLPTALGYKCPKCGEEYLAVFVVNVHESALSLMAEEDLVNMAALDAIEAFSLCFPSEKTVDAFSRYWRMWEPQPDFFDFSLAYGDQHICR